MRTLRQLGARAILAVSLALTVQLDAGAAAACGGTFCSNSPIVQNAERVLFLKRPGDPLTTAVVQIQATGNDPDFAWVVPLDSVPENVHEEASQTFAPLDRLTAPVYQFFGGARFSVGTGSSGFGCGASEATVGAAPREADGVPNVQVWAMGETGNYAFSVVSSDNPDALRRWLDTNGYRTPESAVPIIAEYVAENKYFLAVRLRALQGVPAFAVTPLAFSYRGRGPCVPIRLTRIATAPTLPVLTYVISDRRGVPLNFAQTAVSDAEVARLGPTRFSTAPMAQGQLSPYDQLVTDAVTEAGGRAWITEYAGELPDGADANFSPTLRAGLPARPYLTRMYTTISTASMDRDPEFAFVSGLPDVSNVHDLSRYADSGSAFDPAFLALGSLVGSAALHLRRRARRRAKTA